MFYLKPSVPPSLFLSGLTKLEWLLKWSSIQYNPVLHTSSPEVLIQWSLRVLMRSKEVKNPIAYAFEPIRVNIVVRPVPMESGDSGKSERMPELETQHIGNNKWCRCGACIPMLSHVENVCCQEVNLEHLIQDCCVKRCPTSCVVAVTSVTRCWMCHRFYSHCPHCHFAIIFNIIIFVKSKGVAFAEVNETRRLLFVLLQHRRSTRSLA